jgi:hypothetical protein
MSPMLSDMRHSLTAEKYTSFKPEMRGVVNYTFWLVNTLADFFAACAICGEVQ